MNYLPGTASLIQEIDKKLLVVLRDGRTLIGFLRSIDQFANLVLHRTIERIHVGKKFGDIPRGIFIVRGENVVLCGEIGIPRKHMTSPEFMHNGCQLSDTDYVELQNDKSVLLTLNDIKDLENENNLPLEQVSIDEILEMQREEQLQKQQEEEKKKKALMERGLQPNDHSVMDEFF